MSYVGDFTPGKTVRLTFNTKNAAGTPFTLAGTPVVSVYKRGNLTESVSGVTLTVDYDSRTGYHEVAINTGADGTFYAAGNDFGVVVTTGTVDGVSWVGTEVGAFSLSNRSALRPATADRQAVIDPSGRIDVGLWRGDAVDGLLTGKVQADVRRWLGVVPLDLVDQRVSALVGAYGSGLAPLDAAGTRSALGLATANADTQLAAILAAAADAGLVAATRPSAWDVIEALQAATVQAGRPGSQGEQWAATATDAETAATEAAGGRELAGEAVDVATAAMVAAVNASDGVAALDVPTATENADALLARTVAAPTSVPTAPYTVASILGWLLAVLKFRRTQSATTETVYEDDGTTPLATSAKSDAGGTFTVGEYQDPS